MSDPGSPGDLDGGAAGERPRLDLPPPPELARIVRGLSDDDLAARIAELGIDEVLIEIFTGMREAFDADSAGDVDAECEYRIRTDDGDRPWTLVIAGGRCDVRPGPARHARITLSLQMTDLVRLVLDEVRAADLYMSGRLRLKGDLLFGNRMQNFFSRPA